MSHCVRDSSDDLQLKLRTIEDLHCRVGLLGKDLDGLFQGTEFYGFLALIGAVGLGPFLLLLLALVVLLRLRRLFP
ncbi:hypothetical protein [Prochlorococcus marinus]|uniref:hypothetical protein n=1 Tax=Prochlorococcus marinus TaxID=1219 RepID=UPI00059DFFEB|nr:hypothetical protein [Prochlorococcus marinus]